MLRSLEQIPQRFKLYPRNVPTLPRLSKFSLINYIILGNLSLSTRYDYQSKRKGTNTNYTYVRGKRLCNQNAGQ